MFKKGKPLKDPADSAHAYEYAIFLLNLSMRTEAEVREKMKTRGYLPEVIKEVVVRLLEDKYLNDEHYAEVFIENLKRYKYYGKFMMKKKLWEKKLPKELVDEKLSELVSEDDEKEIAKNFVVKKFGPLKEVRKMEYIDKQKIMRALLSRGFGLDLAKELVG